MLQTSWEYSERWQFTFNITKTVLLTFGKKEEEYILNCGIRNWKLGSSDISGKDIWSNLGEIWDIDKDILQPLSLVQLVREERYASF